MKDFLIKLLGGHKATIIYVKQTRMGVEIKSSKTYPLNPFTTTIFVDRNLYLSIDKNGTVKLLEKNYGRKNKN